MNAPLPGLSLSQTLPGGSLLSCWHSGPGSAGQAPLGLGWPGPPGPPPAHPHTWGRSPRAAWVTSAAVRRRPDGHGWLDRQSVRPKIAHVWAAAAGEGQGGGPARGFRLHYGIFPLGRSCVSGAQGRVGVPSQVSFWALGAVTKPALPVGVGGQACLRGTRGQLSGPCLGGLASQPRAAWEGSRPCRLPENALSPAPTISLLFLWSSFQAKVWGCSLPDSALQLPAGSQAQSCGLGAA